MKLSCFVNFDIISCLCSWLSGSFEANIRCAPRIQALALSCGLPSKQKQDLDKSEKQSEY